MNYAPGNAPAEETLIQVHMTPDELAELEEMQGGRTIDQNGNPSLGPLGDLLMSPEGQMGVDEWERSNYAGGGEVEGINRFMASQGRNGDEEYVSIPPVLESLFDRALNNSLGRGPTINPRTGQKEYFLGSLLGGLATTVLPKVAPLIGKGIGKAVSGIGKFFGLGGDSADRAGQGLGAAAESMASGYGQMSPWELARQGVGAGLGAATKGMSSPWAAGARQFGQAMSAGMPWQQSMMSGANAGINAMQNPWMRQVGQAGMQGINSYMGGAPWQQSVQRGMSALPTRGAPYQMMNAPMQAAQTYGQERLGGAGMGQSALRGGAVGMQNYLPPAAGAGYGGPMTPGTYRYPGMA